MKFRLINILLFFIINSAFSQDLEIANWLNDKKGAVVLTFDDWLEGHEEIVVPELEVRGIPATFYVTIQNTKWRKHAFREMRRAQANGCEIANHTITHPDLTTLSLFKAKKEIFNTRQIILDSIPGARCLTFAYPMGTKNSEIIELLGQEHIGARSISPANESDIKYNFARRNEDYFNINTVRIWRIISPSKVDSWIDYTAKGGGLLTFMIHSVYNDTIEKGWDAVPQDYMNSILDIVKAKQDVVWVTTLEKALLYHQEKREAKIIDVISKQKTLTFSLSCNLEDSIYNQELTIKIPLKGKEIKKIKIGKELLVYNYSEDGIFALVNLKPNQKNVKVLFK